MLKYSIAENYTRDNSRRRVVVQLSDQKFFEL